MIKNIFKLLLILAAITSCSTDPTRYELKSPCTAADSENVAPCVRTPINKSIS